MNSDVILIAAAVVAYVLIRRVAGQPLGARRLVVVPLILTAWGTGLVVQAFHPVPHSHALDLQILVVGVVLGVLGGVARGLTVRIYTRDGHLWFRYRALTVVIWLALIGLRVLQTVAGDAMGADPGVLAAALPMLFGVSLLGEAAVVGARAYRTGTPWAPRRAEPAGR